MSMEKMGYTLDNSYGVDQLAFIVLQIIQKLVVEFWLFLGLHFDGVKIVETI